MHFESNSIYIFPHLLTILEIKEKVVPVLNKAPCHEELGENGD
jgi:hypothetical protein